MRSLPLLFVLAACGVATDSADEIDYATETVVAPGLNGEWDDPDAVPNYRSITGTIQQAIDGLSGAGPHLITVQSGDFTENVVIDVDNVTIQGAGSNETVIWGSVTIDGGSVATEARLERLSVINPNVDKTGVGIDVDDTQVFLEAVDVSWWDKGVELTNADNSFVSRSTFDNNRYGVWSDYSDNADFHNNLFRSNDIAGLTNYFGDGGAVAFNTFVGNAFSASSQLGFGGAMQFGDPTETERVLNNIVVSNFFGVNCQNCGNSFSSNLVWGNATNYVNDASQQSDDIPLDPRFTNPGAFDFSIQADSPAIDAANGTFTVSEDFWGEARPSGSGHDIGMDEYVQSGFDLAITEVLANAPSAVGEGVGEFVEIYNAGSTTVDLAGLVLTDGDEADTLTAFSGGATTLAAGAYAVVVDPDYDGSYSIDSAVTVVTTQDTEVGNGLTTADRVTLLESDGTTTIATFGYPDDPGDGISMEMVLLAGGDAAGNWRGSVCGAGYSPGAAACFPPPGDVSALVITEVLANAADESTGEFIELWNSGSEEIDAAGLVIDDGTGSDALTGFGNSGTLIPPGGHAVILDSGFAYQYVLPNGITLLTTDDGSALGTSGLANSGESITLYESDGTTAISTFGSGFSPTDAGNGVSWQRVDYSAADTTSNWTEGDTNCATAISPGRLNQPAGGICTHLVITEVLANPLDEDKHEFLEVLNAGDDNVDFADLSISDGTQSDELVGRDGGSTVLAPGDYAVIHDVEYDDFYDPAPDAIEIVTTDTTLGNALSVADEVSLWIGSSRLDVFNFPFNPGNGFSAEQIDPYATNAAENWVASPCAIGSSRGLPNCATSGTAGGSGSSAIEVVITEVMANAIDEDTDEFVEIHNYGSTAVDVALFVLWDGDEIDTVQDWYGGTDTVIQPGAYAVILDFEYDMTADPYGLASAPVVLTTSDTTVGSGLSTADEVYLFEPDGSTLIDSFTSPSNPGNGISIEKIDVLGGDLGSNWRASSCANHTAGAANCTN